MKFLLLLFVLSMMIAMIVDPFYSLALYDLNLRLVSYLKLVTR